MITKQSFEIGVSQYMSTFADRFIEARKSKGWEQEDLAEHAGVKQQTISAIETGKTLQPRTLSKLARTLGYREEWLLYGAGERTAQGNPLVLITWNQLSEWCKLRQPIIKEKDAPVIHFGSFNKNCFAVTVQDDSMHSPSATNKSFDQGDVIVIDPDKEPKNGNLVIAYEKGAPTAIFKQLIIDGARSFLRPLNPQYSTIQMSNDITICGVVVGDFRIYDDNETQTSSS